MVNKILMTMALSVFLMNTSHAALTANKVPVAKTGGTTPVLMDSPLSVSGSNVGIGTTSSVYNLHVKGPIIGLDNTGTTDITYANIANAYGTVRLGVDASGVAFSGSISAIPFSLKSGNSEVVRFDTSGNIGIGTVTPTKKLEIGGAGSKIKMFSPNGTAWSCGPADSTGTFTCI